MQDIPLSVLSVKMPKIEALTYIKFLVDKQEFL